MKKQNKENTEYLIEYLFQFDRMVLYQILYDLH